MICKNCSLCSCRVYPQLAKPINTAQRSILVIGETITVTEAKRGTVMTGHGAEILKQTMAKVGLPTTSDKVCFTTAFACAIPKKKGVNTFPKDAITHCRTRLLEEIRLVQPKLILVCGKVALQTLTGDMNIKVTSEYGRARKYPYCGDADVIPIMNPGLILHSPSDYKPFLAMLQLAASYYQGGGAYDRGTVEWTVLKTEEDCRRAWNFLMATHNEGNLPYVTCDIETTGLDYRIAEFLVLGICYAKNKVFVIPREMKHLIRNFLEISSWKYIWQVGKYDKKVMWARQLANVNIGGDTAYLHYILDETSPHDLEYLAKTYLQAEAYKYKMNQNWKSVNLESYHSFFDALCERVAVDCDYTYQLVEVLEEEVRKEPSLQNLYDNLLIPAANFLTRVEENGILVNPVYLEEQNEKYQILLDYTLDEIRKMAEPFWDPYKYMQDTGHKTAPQFFNPGAPDQMAWMVFDRLKLKPRVKKGRSTDKDILKSIEPTPPLVKKVLEYRSIQKEKSTYIEGLLKARDSDGRVRTTFSLHVTATGRLSSKEPNVQNQPSANGVAKVVSKDTLKLLGIDNIGKIRQAFVPRKDYVLAEIDYAGAELRWLAFLSHCPVLSAVFINNRNLHVETATSLFGPHFDKAQKLRAKAVNFGIPYGREEQSFVDEFNITWDEAHNMITGWLNTYHGARDYLQWCADQVVLGNYLETPFGRRRRFGLVTPESLHALQNEARNFPIQSSSSDLLLYCAMEAEKHLLKEFDTRIINLIHDSILLEIPNDKQIVAEVGKYTNKLMVDMPVKLFDCPIPFKTDFEVGTDWENLVAFNCNTLKFEEEVDDDIIEHDYNNFINSHYHWEVYTNS
jgi:uracil-DNA glycosylase family 4